MKTEIINSPAIAEVAERIRFLLELPNDTDLREHDAPPPVDLVEWFLDSSDEQGFLERLYDILRICAILDRPPIDEYRLKEFIVLASESFEETKTMTGLLGFSRKGEKV